MEPIYTVKELAARWKCSVDAVYDMIRRGVLPSIRIGKSYRVTGAAVEAYEAVPEMGDRA